MGLNEKIDIIKMKKEKKEIQLSVIKRNITRDHSTEDILDAVVKTYQEVIDLLEMN